MKAKNLLWAVVALFATFSMTAVLSSCEKKSNEPIVVNPGGSGAGSEEEEEGEETQPELKNPGEGKVTICVQAPKAMCGYLVAPGSLTNWDPGDGSDKKLELVEGYTTWYAGTFDWKQDVAFKIAATDAEGQWVWAYQLLSGELIQGLITPKDPTKPLTSDLIIDEDNQVIYIKVTKFETDPCSKLAPAGTATFNLTATGFPEGTEFAIAGSFAEPEDAWNGENPSEEHKLTLKDGVYTATFEVPAVFQYKYLVKYPGDEKFAWYTAENINMDPSLVANDTEVYVAPEETPEDGATEE